MRIGQRPFKPHQSKAFKYCQSVQHPFLAMQMRLGKTLVAIRYLRWKYPNPAARFLISAPITVLEAWERELKLEREPYRLLLGSQEERLEAMSQEPHGGFYLVNYDGARVCPWLAGFHWDGVVLDESPKIKNPQAQVSKIFCSSFRGVQTKMCLSGNPAPEDSLNWFQQAKFLWDGFLNCVNFWQFRQAYYWPIGYGWSPRPGTIDTLYKILRQRVFFMTAKQAGINNERVYEKRYVELPEKLRKAYDSLEDDFAAEIDEQQIETSWETVKGIKLAQIAGGWDEKNCHKTKELCELLEGELRGDRMVVFFRFNTELHRVAAVLARAGYCIFKATGEDTYDERKLSIERFRHSAGGVLLAQTATVAQGLDFSAASVGVFFSNYYSAELREHAEARFEHPDKRDGTLLIDLVSKGTSDEDCLWALQDKRTNSSVFFSRMFEHMQFRRNRNDRADATPQLPRLGLGPSNSGLPGGATTC